MPNNIPKDFAEIIKSHDKPDPELVEKHNIKLGLRNADGTGVVVGITSKGTVLGYKKENGKVIPAEGRLLYCGIDIRELIEAHKNTFGFEEIAYLLLTGELPNKMQLKRFSELMRIRRSLSNKLISSLIDDLTTENVMNSLQMALQALSQEMSKEGVDPNSVKIEDVTLHSIDIIAKFPLLVAYLYHAMMHKYHRKDLKIFNPLSQLDHAPNLLHMLRAGEPYTEEEAHILDVFLMLHAEHGGGNNSTFTVRIVSSSETDTYSAMNAGLASLKGHLHGGANEMVVSMMEDIKANVANFNDKQEIFDYLCKIIEGNAGDGSGKIYGIGHAVYTLSDPRAIIFRKFAEELAIEKGKYNEFKLLELVAELAPEVLKKVKGIDKPMAPNVDFYSGFVLKCLGIPVELFTPLFATARVAGWCAHRLEQLVQNKLMRPAYFNAAVEKPYISMDGRG